MRNLFRFIAVRHLQMRPGRTAFSVLGIACGIALYIAISLINDSTSGYFKESMSAVSGKATLTVSAGELGFDAAIGDKVEAIAGVKVAAPVIESRTFLVATRESLMVMGVDLLQEKSVRSYKSEGKAIIGNSLSIISHADSLIVTDDFAKSHHLALNDKIELTTAVGKKFFTVRGILSATGLARAFGGALAIADIDAARVAFKKEGRVDRLDIVTRDGANVDQVAAEIRAAIGPQFTVERPEMASEQMERMVRSFQFMSRFMSALALVVGIMLINNSVAMAVAERRKEIGTLRALGVNRLGILVMFLCEAVMMGSLGSLVGAFAGRWLAGYMVGAVTRAMSNQFTQRIEATDLKFTAATILTAVGIGAVASFLAALFPSVKATQVQPVDAMKRKDTGEGNTKMRRAVPLAGGAMIAVSIFGAMALKDTDHKILQLLMQVFGIIGSALIGPMLVIGAVKLVRPVIIERSSLTTRLAIENMLRNPKRTGANVTNLMVGLILVVIIACVNVSFKGTLMQYFDRILHADMVVSTTGRLQSHEATPLDESLKVRLESHPGVLGAYELREVKFNYQGETLLLKYFGEPPAPEKAGAARYNIWDVQDRDTESAGRELYGSDEPTIMVAENFNVRFKTKTGDHITLMTHKGPVSFRIIATVAEYSNPVGTFIVSKKTYQKFFNDKLVSGFAIKLKSGYDPVQVRTDLDRQLSQEYKLTFLLNNDIKTQVVGVIDSSFAYTRSIELAALVVALLGLMNTLLITVMERTRELGMSRAIGMSGSMVSRMILVEAASQGGLGALISMALGTLLGMLWVTYSLAAALGWVVTFFVPWQAIMVTFGLGLAVTLIAAWYPARRAAAIEIVDALDYE